MADFSGSLTSDNDLREVKVSKILTKELDTIDLDVQWLAWTFCKANGTAMQNRMFDFCVGFLRHWAKRFDTGDIKNTQILYPHCAKASAMIKALDQDQTTRYIG